MSKTAKVMKSARNDGISFNTANQKDIKRMADRLGELAQLRKDVDAEEGELKAEFLKLYANSTSDSIRGDQYTVMAIPSTRTTLDRKALEESMGAEKVAPFLRTTNFITVRTARLQ